MQHAHNLTVAEDRIVSGIVEISVLKERFRQTAEIRTCCQSCCLGECCVQNTENPSCKSELSGA